MVKQKHASVVGEKSEFTICDSRTAEGGWFY